MCSNPSNNIVQDILAYCLIALCGLRIGAVVYTLNEEDFALLHSVKPFRFHVPSLP